MKEHYAFPPAGLGRHVVTTRPSGSASGSRSRAAGSSSSLPGGALNPTPAESCSGIQQVYLCYGVQGPAVTDERRYIC